MHRPGAHVDGANERQKRKQKKYENQVIYFYNVLWAFLSYIFRLKYPEILGPYLNS
jgi:hypothetical protein